MPTTDPDDARRRRLLNILLLGNAVVALVGLLAILINNFSVEQLSGQEVRILLGGTLIAILGFAGIYLINRRISGSLASLLYLLLLTIIFTFTDSPAELAGGRSLFLFTLPIIMASILLSPGSSFIFATLSSVIISVLALSIAVFPNIPGILGFFMLALVSWISARSLEVSAQGITSYQRQS